MTSHKGNTGNLKIIRDPPHSCLETNNSAVFRSNSQGPRNQNLNSFKVQASSLLDVKGGLKETMLSYGF